MHHFLDTILNGPTHYALHHQLSPLRTLGFVLGALALEFLTVFVGGWLVFKVVQNTPSLLGLVLRYCGVGERVSSYSFLELTFPAVTSKSAFATEQQHILLRSLVGYSGFFDRLAARKKPYSLELVASRDDGIRYVLRIASDQVEFVRRNLLSFLPGLKVRLIDDYLSNVAGVPVGVVELKLTADFGLPLQDHKTLAEHDPIATLTGHMTKLAAGELVAFQMVTVPVFDSTHHRVTRHARKLHHAIALRKDLSAELSVQRSTAGHVAWLLVYPPLWAFQMTGRILMGTIEILSSSSQPSRYSRRSPTGVVQRPALDPYQQELGTIVKAKLDQPLFEVTMRLLVAAPSSAVITERTNALVAAFQPFASSRQAIGVQRQFWLLRKRAYWRRLGRFLERRLTPHYLSQQTILSSAELSDLYHLPATQQTKTEGLVKSRSRDLPAPLSISRQTGPLDVYIGINRHGGGDQPLGLTLAQRQKHTYLIGKTGMGKTTLLTSVIHQDMLAGKGLAVLDPHGDMFQELLGLVPADRRKDVVVFDPSDRDWPLGLNLLDPGIKFSSEDDKCDWITSAVLSVFMKLADPDQWGPRMEHILRNATLTALQVPNPSLYTLQRLLTDKKYQKAVAATLSDPVLKQFWQKEFALLGTMQLSSVTAPLTHRLGHFITSKMSRHILLQQSSTLRIGDIMNQGKILLVNLSKGDLGADQSQFFGTILTAFMWMAAYQRTKLPEPARRDFFVYVDEFQNFATPLFSEIASEGRKFHVSLIISHQNIAQIEDRRLVSLLAGNASTLIALKVSPEDEAFILPYMKPEVERGDIINLAPYHFYAKTTGDVSEDAFSGQTVPLDVVAEDEVREAVIARSRRRYGTPKATVEVYMDELFGPAEPSLASQSKTVNNKAAGGLQGV